MSNASNATVQPPRLGFLGLGWIGQHRMQALLDEQACQVAVVADPSPQAQQRVRKLAPGAALASSLDELLAHELDGVVIATPSALHAQQSLRCLERGLAVFCQKPLARTAAETAAMVEAARRADKLLGCDFSYRHTEAMRRIRNSVVEGEIGSVYAADLVFHNAYGPDKSWARDPQLAGGGCAIDLGTHLVDLALWVLGFPEVARVDSRLYAQGRLLEPGATEVEDYAVAQIELATGATVRLACSWNFSAGCDAAIEAHFHGSRGGVAMRNRNGSFFDFAAERYHGTQRVSLAEPPDAWGGRAIVDWARRLAARSGFSPAIEPAVQVATVVDRIYGR
ncbi:Gfo/Idh/MocA family protein [Ramlibacter tataouinensis]|uniref:Oxidoreductases-like protein n=1 Tax=Ramlibacter tataouinensis (strain ATCC BAA-407 / DSM 14655 / LMG 21543 / TTB310) TaxID=365046 RepID=F5Y5J6_RAMTT|nr:Gfo/Idh/MocA family oxidoreductase [Ramlibacter tataouinensis]AEG92692.1 oxidoreductases-like protein [Ramlibacter tataouinensis TTB310]